MAPISLVLTVLNERDTIDALMESVAQQTRQPDEIIVVDGGSQDGTISRLQGWTDRLPLRLICVPGASISAGRNRAIAAAENSVIAVTDAGVRLRHDWLERLEARLSPDIEVVAGFFAPDVQTPFECAMGATVLPAFKDIRADRFLPSSRSLLLKRSAALAVGGYPEWLDYCEDLVFDLALKAAGYRFAFAGDAVAQFRPRGTLGAFLRQYYLYARGDGKASLFLKRHLVRYVTYLALVVLGRQMFVDKSWGALAMVLAGGALYLRRPYQRLPGLMASHGVTDVARAAAWVPVIRLIGDLAKMAGYPAGVAWRLRRGR